MADARWHDNIIHHILITKNVFEGENKIHLPFPRQDQVSGSINTIQDPVSSNRTRYRITKYSKYSLQAHSLQAQPRYRHQNPRVPTFPRQNVFVTGTSTPRYRHRKNHFVPITSYDVIQNADVSGHWGGNNRFRRKFWSFSGA